MEYKKVLAFARELRKRQTPAEEYFWKKVRNRRFLGKKFNRQFIIEHEEILGNKKFFIADFHCYEKRLIVEIDGDIHLKQKEYDEAREEILRKMGYYLVRFTNEEVLKNWPDVKQRLRDLLL